MMKYIQQCLRVMNLKGFYLAFIVLFLGCNTTKQVQFVKEKANAIELGVIVKKEGILKNNIEIKGMPVFDQKLRVSILEKEFTKASFKEYADVFDTKKPSISYDDTIKEKATYVEIELIDDIGYARAINEDVAIQEYVKNSKNAGVISKVSVVSKVTLDITKMTSAFLETINNQYVITVYNGEELLMTIPFSDMVIFNYQTSFFCYGKNERNQVVVMDITEDGKSCKRPLERKATKLLKIKKLVDY